MTKKTVRHAGSLLLALLLCLMAGTALAGSLAVVDADSTKLHLRAEPTSSSKSLGLFFTGTVVEILHEDNGWAQVIVGTDEGYMAYDQLTTGNAALDVKSCQPTGYVSAKNYAYVRSGPSTDYAQIATLERNTPVIVLGETDEHWYYVDIGSTDGYISKNLVSLNRMASSDVPDGFAVIDSHDSKRLRLRAGPSKNSDSLGLYYAGTQVKVEGHSGDWTKVTIGTETGYMASSYLKTGEAAKRVESKQPIGYVKAKNGGNLRSEPSQDHDPVGLVERGSAVTVLGETYNNWYYVQAGNRCGYMSRNLISLDGPPANEVSQPSQPSQRPNIPIRPSAPSQQAGLPADLPYSWYYASGAGAWGTELNLNTDGTFSGRYDDTDMGENAHYESLFKGRFSNIRQVDALTYTMTLSDLSVQGTLGDSYYSEDGLRYIVSDPVGLQEGELFTLYLPGSDMSSWSEDKKSWLNEEGPRLTGYYLYGGYSDSGFVGNDL